MDGARLSPYPHYSWLASWLSIRPPKVFECHEDRHVTHRLLLTTAGDADVAWTTGGNEVRFHSTAGDIGFYPCDHAPHMLAVTATGDYRAYTIFIPERHLDAMRTSDDAVPGRAVEAIPVFRDALLEAGLLRLAGGSGCRCISENIGDEIAAQRIVMRLSEVVGCGAPDWHRDTSVFAPHVMRQIVERVDAHLATHVALEHVSRGFGLSPSHFARKFRRSTGLSLNRFMNRRRIGLSLAVLERGGTPLAQLSLDLGFCSQSHFTRLFSGLTGLTPHQFSRGHRHQGE